MGAVESNLERANLGHAHPCLDWHRGIQQPEKQEDWEQENETAPDSHPDPSWTSRITGSRVRAGAHALLA
jgi:hypothetical protein